MRRHLYLFILFFIGNISFVTGQDCDCDHTITLEQKRVDGNTLDVQPGHTICIAAGNRDYLRLENFSGSADAPLLITNCGGQVVISGNQYYGIGIVESSFFRLTGSGDDAHTYGFKIVESGAMGVQVAGFSTDFEIDHIEVENVGFAGIMAKHDPSCSNPDLRDFVMRNILLHDNYLHDTGGEGFYIGYSWFPAREVDCQGTETTLYAHEIQSIRIYNNIIHNTGWDGLQVGCATSQAYIYNNEVENYGIEHQLYQNNGVQIGAGTTGDFFNNVIKDGTGTGISFFGYGNNRVYNNLLIRCGELGIYHNDKGAREDTYYYIINNTIVSPGNTAVRLVDAKTTGNIVANNILTEPGNGSFIEGANARWTKEANLTSTDVAEVYFKDPSNDDYQLTALSPAIDAGLELPGNWLRFDALMRERPSGEKYDIGAFEYDADDYDGEIIVTGLLDHYDAPYPLNFYPNPVESILHLELEDITFGTLAIEVYNLLGKTCLEKQYRINGNAVAVNLEKLPQGSYLISLLHDGTKGRFIKILKK